MRKFSMALLGVFVLALSLMIPDIKVSADDGNSTIFNAVEFTSKKSVTDEIESDSDIDWFKYTVNSKGTICFSFVNISEKGARWDITIFDENGQNQIWNKSTDWNAASTSSPLYSFASGTVLTFRIKNCDSSKGLRYQLSAMIDESGDWSEEDNGNYLKSSILTDKKPLLGIINTNSEVDWYKYTVNSTNPFKIVLDNMSEKNSRWSFSIYDNDGSTLLWNKNTDWSVASTASVNLMYEKGHELYIKINNCDSSENKIYQIKTVIDNNTGWAKEDNGSSEKAYKINSANDIKEFLGPNNDIDWYVYSAKKNEKITFEFSNTESASGRWKLRFYEGNVDKLINEKNLGWDEFSYKYEIDATKGTQYYICVSNCDSSYDKVYKLSVKDTVEHTSKDVDVSGSEDAQGITTPYSILAGTNVVVGKADPGAKVSVKYGKKTYTATADADGIYRVKTAKLKKGKSVTIWQTVDKQDSEKVTVKVVNKY